MAITAGSGVLIDATFRRRALTATRSPRDGGPTGSLTFVQCLASAEVLRCRAVAREHDPHRASDATPDVVERERRDLIRSDDANPAGHHLVLRTDPRPPVAVASPDLRPRCSDLRLAGRSGGRGPELSRFGNATSRTRAGTTAATKGTTAE